jgi:hypothetical protein
MGFDKADEPLADAPASASMVPPPGVPCRDRLGVAREAFPSATRAAMAATLALADAIG